MKALTISAKNGIAVSETIYLNPANIIKYSDNADSYAILRYDTDPGGKDKPVDYTLSISKAALDLLVPIEDSGVIVSVGVLDATTGVSTPTSFNQKYITSLRLVRVMVAGTLTSSVVEMEYSDGAFVAKSVYLSTAIGSISYIAPLHDGKYDYKAYLTQVSTAAPTDDIIKDTIDGVWTRSGAGTYLYTKAGKFLTLKSTPNNLVQMYDPDDNLITAERLNDNAMQVKTYAAADTTTLADGVLSGHLIHFESFV